MWIKMYYYKDFRTQARPIYPSATVDELWAFYWTIALLGFFKMADFAKVGKFGDSHKTMREHIWTHPQRFLVCSFVRVKTYVIILYSTVSATVENANFSNVFVYMQNTSGSAPSQTQGTQSLSETQSRL